MRFIASADHHFDEHRRFDECRRIHAWIAEQVEAERPDVFLSAGDIYERASTPVERLAVAEWLTRIADVCPVVIARGNHDRALDLDLLEQLEAPHPIHVEAAARVVELGGAQVAVLPWPSLATLGSAMGATGERLAEGAREALRSVLGGLGAAMDPARPRLLLAHAMVDGSVTSVGQPLIGAELHVALSDLALARAQIAILGHIHAPQEWTVDGVSMLYTGSPFRTSFGEAEDKSIVVGEVCVGGAAWERRTTPATPMVDLEARLDPSSPAARFAVTSKAFPHEARIAGAEVRLRYSTPSDCRDEARAAAAELADVCRGLGAVSVKVEEQVDASVRARMPEVATATTLPAKLDALWAARAVSPEPERRERLLSKLALVEENAR